MPVVKNKFAVFTLGKEKNPNADPVFFFVFGKGLSIGERGCTEVAIFFYCDSYNAF